MAGYYKNTNGGCTKCSDGCTSCSATGCTTCASDYYKTALSAPTCVKCSSVAAGCTACTTDTTANQCWGGWSKVPAAAA